VLMDILAGQVGKVTVSIMRGGIPAVWAVLSALLDLGLLLRPSPSMADTSPGRAHGPCGGVAIVAFLLNMQCKIRELFKPT